MKVRRFAALLIAFGAVGGALVAAVAAPAAAQTPTATATATATTSPTPAPTFAPCPTGATLTVSPPTTASPTTVTVSVSPATLNVKAATAGDPASFHLHYFIDTPATATGAAIPSGDAKIIHSGTTTQDLGALTPGQHTVTVVLGQLSHVACDTRSSVTFIVAQTTTATATAAAATPAAPKTGNAGELADDSGLQMLALLVGVVLLAVGGRMLIAGQRR